MQQMQQNIDHELEGTGKTLSMEALQGNMMKLDKARSFFSIIAGILAGVLYCTSYHGLIAYVVMSVLINGALLIKMGFDTNGFTTQSFISFLSADMSKNAMSFILFWTLSYALVYLY